MMHTIVRPKQAAVEEKEILGNLAQHFMFGIK